MEYEIAKKGFTYALLTAGDDERFIPPMRGQFYDIVPFWATEPTVRKVYRVSMPMEKELQFQFYQANVPLPCDMRMDGKYIPSPPTISFLSPRNRIW
mgnify:FL=1